MEVIPQLQAALAIIIPLIGTLLPGILSQDRLPEWANAIISGLTVIAISVVSGMLASRFTGNVYADSAVFVAILSSMMAGPLKGLTPFLQSKVFSFGKPVAPTGVIPAIRRSSVITQATGGKVQPGQWAKTDDGKSG